MDFTGRSSSLIIDRLIEKSTHWPENSRSFWVNAESSDELWFSRRALCVANWSPTPCEKKTMEFWNDVPGTLIKRWMEKYRLVLLQADGLENYLRREEFWLRALDGEMVWEDPRFEDMFAL